MKYTLLACVASALVLSACTHGGVTKTTATSVAQTIEEQRPKPQFRPVHYTHVHRTEVQPVMPSTDIKTQEDAAHMDSDTITTRTVTYRCSTGETFNVHYGFNQQQLPTFAQINVDGKARFMPINLNSTDNVSTVFGDENNFSLYGNMMDLSNYRRTSVSVLNPASEFIYKGCNPR